jgi:hypothetical protein
MAVSKTSGGKANKKSSPRKKVGKVNKFGYVKPSLTERILTKDWPLAVMMKKASRMLPRHNSNIAVK